MSTIFSKNTNIEYGEARTYGWPGIISLTYYDSKLEKIIESLINDDHLISNSPRDNSNNAGSPDNLTSALKRFFVLDSHGVPKNIRILAIQFKKSFNELTSTKTSIKSLKDHVKIHPQSKLALENNIKKADELNKQSGKLFEALKKEVCLYYETITAYCNSNETSITERTMDITDYYKPIYEWFKTSYYDYASGAVISK